ncbi:MAG: tetratricopeptide repeat protein, partial [Deltaproteobacteria bacterium]|nr:tetratricopeptide repeat protein [Deltaproteobacteria bacterium]
MGRSRRPRMLGLAAALWLWTLASPVSAQSGQAAERARRQRAHELVELGLRHQRAGDLGSAIGYYREAVAAWSRGVRAYAQLAEAYQARGRHADALAALDAGLSRHPEALRLLLDRARSLEALGRSEEAAAALRRATRGRAESGRAW